MSRSSIAAKYRREARAHAVMAARFAVVGNIRAAEEQWLFAKDSAAKAAGVQAYDNGFRDGKKSKREGSR